MGWHVFTSVMNSLIFTSLCISVDHCMSHQWVAIGCTSVVDRQWFVYNCLNCLSQCDLVPFRSIWPIYFRNHKSYAKSVWKMQTGNLKILRNLRKTIKICWIKENFRKNMNKLEAQCAEPVSLIFHSALRKLSTEPYIGAS
jgi:hypothetical protein